jgi:hypothetical protein
VPFFFCFLIISSFLNCITDQHQDQKSVLDQLKVTQLERAKSNRMLLEKRKNSSHMITDDGVVEVVEKVVGET